MPLLASVPVQGRPHRYLFIVHTTLADNTEPVRLCPVLTFEFIVLRVRWEKGVWKQLGEGEASILGPVLNIVSDCRLQFLHKFWTWSS